MIWNYLQYRDAAAAVLVVGLLSGASARPEKSLAASQNREAREPELVRRVAQLGSSDPDQRVYAVEALAKLGSGGEPALEALTRLLDDPVDEVCVAGVRAIVAIGPAAARAVPAIVKMARRQNREQTEPPKLCAGVAEPRLIGPAAIPYLIAELGRDPSTDFVAAEMLASFGVDSLTPVIEALARGGPRAQAATEVIWRLGDEARPALPALVKAVRSRQISEATFVFTVSEMGVADEASLRELRRLVEHAPDERTRFDAKQALLKLDRK